MWRLLLCLLMLPGLGGCLFMVDDSGTGYLRAKSVTELRSWVLSDLRTSERLAEGIHVLGLWVRGTDEAAAGAHARVLVEVFDKLERAGYIRIHRDGSKELQALVIRNLYGPTASSRVEADELHERVSDPELSRAFAEAEEREWKFVRSRVRNAFGEPAVIEQQAGDESRYFRSDTDPGPAWAVERETWYYLGGGRQVVMERGGFLEGPVSPEKLEMLRQLMDGRKP